jgi:hypothetical protein
VTPAKNCCHGSRVMLGVSERLRREGFLFLEASAVGRRGAAASPLAEWTAQPGSTMVMGTKSAAMRRGTASPGQRKVIGDGVS